MDFASISKLLQADAKKFQAYAEAKVAIDSLAAKSNLAKEIEAAIVKLQAERAKVEAEVSNATQALEEIDEEAKLVKSMAKDEALAIIAKANADAAKIIAAADKDLADTLSMVDDAKKDLAATKKDVDAAKAAKDKLDAQIEAIKKSLGA